MKVWPLPREASAAVRDSGGVDIIPAFVWRVLRYGGMGIAVSLIYSLAVIVCVRALDPISPTVASILAFIIVLPVSWLAHGKVSFSDRPYDRFQPLRFAVSTSASFVVAIGGMYCITEVAGQSYLLGIAWNWLIIPAMNFLAYMLFVFRAGHDADGLYVYGPAFQTMAATGSAHAARRIVSMMLTILPVRSVIDLGCARGTWLREWRAQGVGDIVGVDCDYVDRQRLEIDPDCFVVHDLSGRLTLGRGFDVVQCLEVAEHLPPSRAATLVEDMVTLAPVVLFSAAPPGQGGENHVNEQPGDYWRALFRVHDYVAVDCLRPLLAREADIPNWYRYNIVLYVRRDRLGQIDAFARQFALRDGEGMTDPSPLTYRLRKRVVRAFPQALCNRLAQWNARRFSSGRAPE
jgi:putative flippase GtrA